MNFHIVSNNCFASKHLSSIVSRRLSNNVVAALIHHQLILAVVCIERDGKVHLLHLGIVLSILLAVVGQLILEHVAYSAAIALLSQVYAQANQSYQEEAEDHAAHDEQDHVLLNEFGHSIVAIARQSRHGVWLEGPLTQVQLVLRVVGTRNVVLLLEELHIHFFDSGTDPEARGTLTLHAIDIEVGVVLFEVLHTKVEGVGVLGTSVRQQAQVALARPVWIDPLSRYKQFFHLKTN